jgi:DNA-binding NarL/FixJ family response regulator
MTPPQPSPTNAIHLPSACVRSTTTETARMPSARTVIPQALETIAAGGTVLDPDIVRSLLRAHAHRSPVHALSDREREVLSLMAQGRSNAAIAERLVVSIKTVESHIASIFGKLNLHEEPDDHRRVLAVLAAIRHEDGQDGD